MRKLQLSGVAAGLAAAFVLGGVQALGAPEDVAKDVAAIKAAEADWVAAIKAMDVERTVGHYNSAALFMTPGVPPAKGSDVIRAVYKSNFADPGFTLTFSADKVEVSDAQDLAYSHGTFTETATNPTSHKVETVKGSYVTVYHKAANGTWKAVWDIVTPSGPASS
jgi:ketosteroid isomerase-like protein